MKWRTHSQKRKFICSKNYRDLLRDHHIYNSVCEGIKKRTKKIGVYNLDLIHCQKQSRS